MNTYPKVPPDIVSWLNSLKIRGQLRKIADDLGFPVSLLSKIRTGLQPTLDEERINAIRARMPKDFAPLPEPTGKLIPQPNKLEFTFDSGPTDFELYLEQAKRISSMGTTLRRLERFRGKIKDTILGGATACILFIDMKEEALRRYATIQDRGRGDAQNIRDFLKDRQESADWWFNLKYSDVIYDSRIEIRKLDYPPSIGIDVLDLKDDSARLYIRSYPLMHSEWKRGREEDDRPIVQMASSDGFWFRHYREQFERHWALAGEPWHMPPAKSPK